MDRQFWACVKGDAHVGPSRLFTTRQCPRIGLVSIGTYVQGLYHSAGQYARKLFLKEEPLSPRIDITQTGLDPSKKAVFETVINAAAANAIGLKLDPALLKNADLIID